MYRIATNLGDPDPNTWSLETFFDMEQPISSAPSVAIDELANIWVYWGTGRYYTSSDLVLDGAESWSFYGVKDRCPYWFDPTHVNCSTPTLKANLLDSTNITVRTDETVQNGPAGVSTFDELEQEINDNNFDGWFVDFPDPGERNLFKPGVLGGLVSWTTYLPDVNDVCSLGGSGRLYATFYKTGTAYKKEAVGLEADNVTISTSADLGKGVPSSVGLSITDDNSAMIFSLDSTGAISQVLSTTPLPLKSKLLSWRKGVCQ